MDCQNKAVFRDRGDESKMKRSIVSPVAPDDPFWLLLQAQESGLDRQPGFGQKYRLLEADPDDTEVRGLIEEEILAAERQARHNPNPFRQTDPVNQSTFPGSIFVGMSQLHQIPYLITPEQLTTHCVITGITGGTKTNLILLIVCQLLRSTKE